jgi:hypothetical protein
MHTLFAQVVHAVSAGGASGPYYYDKVVIPPEMENPMALRSASGEYLLYYLDHVNVYTGPSLCTGAKNGSHAVPFAPNSSNVTEYCSNLQPEPSPPEPSAVQGRRLAVASAKSPGGPL